MKMLQRFYYVTVFMACILLLIPMTIIIGQKKWFKITSKFSDKIDES